MAIRILLPNFMTVYRVKWMDSNCSPRSNLFNDRRTVCRLKKGIMNFKVWFCTVARPAQLLSTTHKHSIHAVYLYYLHTCPLLSFISLWMSIIFTVLSVLHKPPSSYTRDGLLSIFLFLNMFLLMRYIANFSKQFREVTRHNAMLDNWKCTERREKHQYNLLCQLNINKNVLDIYLNLHLQLPWLLKSNQAYSLFFWTFLYSFNILT